MMYSIIFLEYDPEGVNRHMTHRSLSSIIGNSGAYDFELIHIKNVKGYAKAVNEGLYAANGDFLVQVANDVILHDPLWLDKMTHEDALVGWATVPIWGSDDKRPEFNCWGMSQATFERVGFMDEQFSEGYGFDDDDYAKRAKQLGVRMIDAGIKLEHLESVTYDKVFDTRAEMMERNKALFKAKWGI